MLKLLLGAIAAVGFVLAGSATLGNGCHDAKLSLTHLTYWPIRDMRQTVVLDPQHTAPLPPDTLSVPVGGREPDLPLEARERMTPRIVDPTGGAADTASVARGERKFKTFCTPCHGGGMAGDGPVAQFFMPPPDLLGAQVRGRSDGYVYAYVRQGGAVMPKYGQALSVHETWDVIHYLRSMQRTSPR